MHISTGILRAAGLLLVYGVALLSTAAHSGSAVTPGSKAASMNSCVAPTAEIRRNHMDYLKHDRNKVVQEGVRDVKNSLAGCVACHAEKNGKGGYHQVNAEGQFCSGCHEYLAVSLTCFQCHSKKPEPELLGNSLSGGENAGQSIHLGLMPVEIGVSPVLSAEEMAQLRAISRGE